MRAADMGEACLWLDIANWTSRHTLTGPENSNDGCLVSPMQHSRTQRKPFPITAPLPESEQVASERNLKAKGNKWNQAQDNG
jgi:hypothetical protein